MLRSVDKEKATGPFFLTNASRPSEHPPVRGENIKTFRWDHKLRGIETGSPMVVNLGQQFNIGDKPTVILYTYINRDAGAPNKTKEKHCST